MDSSDRVIDIMLVGAVIAIIILKLTDIIKVSWLWLLCPLWIPFTIGLGLAIILVIVYISEVIICKINNKEKMK